MRMVKESENEGDLLSYIFKVIPSYAFTDAVLYSTAYETMNNTRNYTEGERLKARKDEEILPIRTNISLESFDLPNIGGDLISLGSASLFFLILLLVVEVGCFVHCMMKCQQIDRANLKKLTSQEKVVKQEDDVL